MNNPEIIESAKAVQEVAKATGTGIKTAEKMGKFLAKIMQESIETVCGMIADDLKIRRWKRQIRLIDCVNSIIEERKFDDPPTPVLPKIALPIFHEASLEDDDFLQDMWANLLVTAMYPQKNQSIRSAYIDIIKQLEPIDVLILKAFYDYYNDINRKQTRLFNNNEKINMLNPTHYPYQQIDFKKIDPELDEINLKTSFDNLTRLQLITPYVEIKEITNQVGHYEPERFLVNATREDGPFCITYLGIFFVKACIAKI